jgi:hypothetical protein
LDKQDDVVAASGEGTVLPVKPLSVEVSPLPEPEPEPEPEWKRIIRNWKDDDVRTWLRYLGLSEVSSPFCD